MNPIRTPFPHPADLKLTYFPHAHMKNAGWRSAWPTAMPPQGDRVEGGKRSKGARRIMYGQRSLSLRIRLGPSKGYVSTTARCRPFIRQKHPRTCARKPPARAYPHYDESFSLFLLPIERHSSSWCVPTNTKTPCLHIVHATRRPHRPVLPVILTREREKKREKKQDAAVAASLASWSSFFLSPRNNP